MKKTMMLVALVILVPKISSAQSAFGGTWRMNLKDTQYVGKQNMSLRDGVYRCDTCVPKINVKADGRDYPQSGSPYSDAIRVRVVSEKTVEIVSKKGGKIVDTETMTASGDGNTLRTESTVVAESGQSMNMKYNSTRVGPAPEGAHKISGLWQPGKLESASENVITVTYKVTDDGLSMSDPTGDSYTAKFDGKDYPYKGDPGITSVSLKKIDANTIEETDKRNGKVINVYRMTLAPDGKTMAVVDESKLDGVTIKWTSQKQ
jgi:hypothetical protein